MEPDRRQPCLFEEGLEVTAEEFALPEATVQGQDVEFASKRSPVSRAVAMSLRAWTGESGSISGFSGLGARTLAALRGVRASLTASLKALWRVTWM
jgi:hypothetical protein